jgi:hypothetical protein
VGDYVIKPDYDDPDLGIVVDVDAEEDKGYRSHVPAETRRRSRHPQFDITCESRRRL